MVIEHAEQYVFDWNFSLACLLSVLTYKLECLYVIEFVCYQ